MVQTEGGEAQEQLNDVTVTRTAVEMQKKLDDLRKQLALSRAQLVASGGSARAAYDNNSLYKVTPTILHKLAQERTRTFLDFTSLQAAVQASQANQAVTQALRLDQGESSVELEPEEEAYVKSLLEQHLELTQDIFKSQGEGAKQELQLFKMRAELAMSYCKYMELREEAGSLLPRPGSEDKDVKELMAAQEQEDCRLNQIRTMCQKLMMCYPKLGCQFDDEEVNARIKAMFCRSGMTPDELRTEKSAASEM